MRNPCPSTRHPPPLRVSNPLTPRIPAPLFLRICVSGLGGEQAYKLCCINGPTAEQKEKMQRLQLACLVSPPPHPPFPPSRCVLENAYAWLSAGRV